MSESGIPILVDRAEVEEYKVGANEDEGTIRRLIARDQKSTVLLGTFRLDPGQSGKFQLPHANGMEEENYYLLAGRLQVRWDGDELIAGPGQAIHFPSGNSYEIETLGEEAVELIWTAYPAPA